MSSAVASCADGVRDDAGLAAIQLYEWGHTPPDDVNKAGALCANGGAEWRCQLALQRQATRLAGLPTPMDGRGSRRGGVGGKPELRRCAKRIFAHLIIIEIVDQSFARAEN
jgi:hypothetical protein